MFPEYVYREANAHKTAYARFTTKGSDSEESKDLSLCAQKTGVRAILSDL